MLLPSDSKFNRFLRQLIRDRPLVPVQFRENVSAWDCFHSRQEVFSPFFHRVLALRVRAAESGQPMNHVK